MESIFEKRIGDINIVSYESSKKIIEQMENCVCKITFDNSQGTGFFCKIPFPNMNNMLPVLITNSHVIGQNIFYQKNTKISLYIKNAQSIRALNLDNRIKHINKAYDISIIELKESDGITNFLELDSTILNEILNNNIDNKSILDYVDSTIYMLQYPEGKLSVSYGILNSIYEDNQYFFSHKCSSRAGSTGSPILNINNNKVIGMHQSSIKNHYNKGIFLSFPIKEFIKINFKNYFLLKDFNKNFNLNIKDTKISRLDLRWKKLGNVGFEELCQIEFKELKELILNNNNISDIKPLEKAKFVNLEILDLSQNKISDINIFEKVNFKGLKQLYLCYNDISNIKVLEKVNYGQLETLVLNDNKIDKNKNALLIANLKSKIGNFEI